MDVQLIELSRVYSTTYNYKLQVIPKQISIMDKGIIFNKKSINYEFLEKKRDFWFKSFKKDLF